MTKILCIKIIALLAAILALVEDARAARSFANVVRVAVIDTGIDTQHPALKEHLWTNPGESGLDRFGHNKSNNGIDDDDNGFVDDLHGWNFASDSPDIRDHHGHGTHVSGIIASTNKVQIMAIKYYDPDGLPSDQLRNTVRAIHYAVQMRAQVINYSGGGLSPSFEEREAIQEAEAKGIIFVAAAGNERSNSDLHPYFPADYGLTNIISVTAHNPEGRILASSNFGIHTVDIAAPGENVLSSLPGGLYGKMTGTSQATAFVSGAAARILSFAPKAKPREVLRFLVQSGVNDRYLTGKTKYGVRLETASLTRPVPGPVATRL